MKTRRMARLAPVSQSVTPRLCALCASPSIMFAPVELRNGTAEKSTMSIL